MSSFRARIADELASLEARSLLRVPRTHVPDGAIDFSSNDYLGLRRDPRVVQPLRDARVAGAGGSRLLGGATREHAALERELAEWLGRERALLFTSGYLAVMGAVATLARFASVAYSDALVHACAIDALRLAKCERRIVDHGTVAVSRADDGPALVVTESLFGMDGDTAPIAEQVAALRGEDVLVVDEAHALGVLGPRGAGLCAAFPDERVIVVGTLSKAFGGLGGFVAGDAATIGLLASTARTFVFDSAAPEAVVASARAALAIVRSEEGDALRERLWTNAARVRAALRSPQRAMAGAMRTNSTVPTGDGVATAVHASSDNEGPIVQLPVGDERTALELSRRLEQLGIFAPAIRPPTVPPGTSRLRITVRADHTAAEIDALCEALPA